ncbi:hypothetical protein H6P81_013506 [Aristolochia fimbriata]|uniref:Uncharacterized protein n=1 Tax=Aristolochia fimbriata TaxID=158543 RepID=A0AAV7EJI8_ARIFI|nr:hypothetical protein H6P81_013506 [Aristolochia fimbriata]
MSVIPSAEFLYEAGVQFRRAPSDSQYLDDVAFDFGGGVLSLPVLAVDDGTESAFLNLVAFERLHVGVGNDVTSYLFFMDNLINTSKDVGLLREERILLSIVGSDEEVAATFNRLSSELTINPDNSLVHVRDMIGRYCDRKWNRWRANLLHNYFTSPWTIISLVIAVLYLILTVLQTNYAIMDFYKPDDDKKSP